jgi:hypothetical protein
LSKSDTWAKDKDDEVVEDESEESKKRSAQGLIGQGGLLGAEVAIILVDKANIVANIRSQF